MSGDSARTTEISWTGNRDAVVWAGSHPVHHYWFLLAPHFGDVLLPPQRRLEGDTVAWSWRETARAAADPSGELEALRRRARERQRDFAETTDSARAPMVAAMETIISRLTDASDPELERFVARTAYGLRLHSWSATEPPVEGGARATLADSDRPEAEARRRRRWIVGVIVVAALAGAAFLARMRLASATPKSESAQTAPGQPPDVPPPSSAKSAPASDVRLSAGAEPPGRGMDPTGLPARSHSDSVLEGGAGAARTRDNRLTVAATLSSPPSGAMTEVVTEAGLPPKREGAPEDPLKVTGRRGPGGAGEKPSGPPPSNAMAASQQQGGQDRAESASGTATDPSVQNAGSRVRETPERPAVTTAEATAAAAPPADVTRTHSDSPAGAAGAARQSGHGAPNVADPPPAPQASDAPVDGAPQAAAADAALVVWEAPRLLHRRTVEVKLLVDPPLATAPAAFARSDAELAVERDRAMREVKIRVPAAFRAPIVRELFLLRRGDGTTEAIPWPPDTAVHDYRSAPGHPAVRLQRLGPDELSLQQTPDAAVTRGIEVTLPATDHPRLVWQRATGDPIPVAWSAVITTSEARLSTPLGDALTSAALFDEDTGWGLLLTGS